MTSTWLWWLTYWPVLERSHILPSTSSPESHLSPQLNLKQLPCCWWCWHSSVTGSALFAICWLCPEAQRFPILSFHWPIYNPWVWHFPSPSLISESIFFSNSNTKLFFTIYQKSFYLTRKTMWYHWLCWWCSCFVVFFLVEIFQICKWDGQLIKFNNWKGMFFLY